MPKKEGGMFTLRVETPNLDRTIKSLDLNNKDVAKAVKAAIRKGTTNAPGIVVDAITARYGIPKSDPEMKQATDGAKASGKKFNQKSKILVRGSLVGGIQLLYQGRVLTPIHFRLSWKQNAKGEYDIRATILKGQRKRLRGRYKTPIFMAPQQTGVMLPWQRVGKKRLPVYAIRTVSVPQMVENSAVRADYEPKIDAMITELVEKNIDELLPKSKGAGASA